jgi:hypothetical protein
MLNPLEYEALEASQEAEDRLGRYDPCPRTRERLQRLIGMLETKRDHPPAGPWSEGVRP